jgi:hypothetical protein
MDIDLKIDFKDDERNKLYQDFLKQTETYSKIAEDKIKTALNRLDSIFKEYQSNCKSLYEKLTDKIYRKEYAVKGENLHRGYYCPSPIDDIIIGNAPRGKILKRVTSRSKPRYEYDFDEEGKLIIARYLYFDVLDVQHIEIILHNNRCDIGILFWLYENGDITIESVSESVYDESHRITSFMKGYIDCNKFEEVYYEIYSYNESGLKTAEHYDWIGDIYTGDKYIFKHNDEGYLSEYVSEPTMFVNDKFQVDIKRKV